MKDLATPRDELAAALEYVRQTKIRDVLLTGGDAFMLGNSSIAWLLEQLDKDSPRGNQALRNAHAGDASCIDDELCEILATCRSM